MLIYFAGAQSKEDTLQSVGVKNILVSYAYKDNINFDRLKNFEHVFLDSGAFTALVEEWAQDRIDRFVEGYMEWLKGNHQHFHQIAEFDAGDYNKIKENRIKLREIIGDKLVEVWHSEQGYEELTRIAKESKFIAYGGETAKGDVFEHAQSKTADRLTIPLSKVFGAIKGIDTKLHGFGITSPELLRKFPFYSVDSTSWLSGAKYGATYAFNGRELLQIDKENKADRGRFVHKCREFGIDHVKLMADDGDTVNLWNALNWRLFNDYLSKIKGEALALPKQRTDPRFNGLKHGLYAKHPKAFDFMKCPLRCEEWTETGTCAHMKLIKSKPIKELSDAKKILKDMIAITKERFTSGAVFENSLEGGTLDRQVDRVGSELLRQIELMHRIETLEHTGTIVNNNLQVNNLQQYQQLQRIDLAIKELNEEDAKRKEADRNDRIKAGKAPVVKSS